MMFTAPTLRKALTLAGFITGLWQCSHSRLTVAVWFLTQCCNFAGVV